MPEGYSDPGYRLNAMRILLVENTPAGIAREFILLHNPPAYAAKVFRHAPECG